jgi:hypothetical protein
MGGTHIACIGEIINAYRILARNPERMRPLGRLLHRSSANIKVEFED